MKNTDFKAIAKKTLQAEADAILQLQDFINDDFIKALHLIKEATGRLVVTGIGKSAIIGQKIVATLNSTGTPAIFMHAAEAIHGDLGMIQPEDVVLCISKSGNTPEISVLIPFFKHQGNRFIALVGNMNSFLAKEADVVINCSVEREACPNNLAPTCSYELLCKAAAAA
jgi:arabinose-5-phosphate isomerase